MSMMRKWRRQMAAIAALPLATALLAARASTPTRAAAPRPVPSRLSSTCGIDYAQVGNRYYEADGPLTGAEGTLTVTSPTQAVLTTKPGHRVTLTLVPPDPARTTARVCP